MRIAELAKQTGISASRIRSKLASLDRHIRDIRARRREILGILAGLRA